MFGIVGDARHDLGATESLRVLKRSVRNQLATFEVDQTQDDSRGTQVHCDAEYRPGGALHFDSVDKNPISVASDRGIEFKRAIAERQSECVTLDAHVSATHGMAADMTLCGRDARLTRKAKAALQMALRLGKRRQRVHPFNHLNHALFAFALLAAGGRHFDAHSFGVIEQRLPSRRLDRLSVDGEVHRHSLRVPTNPSLRVRLSALLPLRARNPRALLLRSISIAPGSRRRTATPVWRREYRPAP